MENELKLRIIDYFTAEELVEVLKLTTEEIVDIFDEEVIEKLPAILELMGE